jgi:phospholipid/cholesterol/gamma-HCH transport system ATP-binding protein
VSSAPLAEARDLAVVAREGSLRVEGLAFRIAPGEALVLSGPVEAGTAVLRALVGVEEPAAGSAWLFGERLAALPRGGAGALLSRIGWYPRSGALLANLTLRENLLLPLQFHRRAAPGEAARAASAALGRFGLDEAPDVRPEDASLPLRRLVALARAMVLEPDLLVLDDPLDDLEEEMARAVLSALVDWARERPRGLLLSSHRAGIAPKLGAPALPLPVIRA